MAMRERMRRSRVSELRYIRHSQIRHGWVMPSSRHCFPREKLWLIQTVAQWFLALSRFSRIRKRSKSMTSLAETRITGLVQPRRRHLSVALAGRPAAGVIRCSTRRYHRKRCSGNSSVEAWVVEWAGPSVGPVTICPIRELR